MKKNEYIKDLYKIQTVTKSQLDELENHNDIINTNINLGVLYLSQIIPDLALKSVIDKKVNVKKIVESMGNVLTHIMLLSTACNFEMPEDDELILFEETFPAEIRNDSILLVLQMMESFIDISMLINVDSDNAIWDDEELPDGFEEDVLTMLVSIKMLGDKHGFTFDDVIDNSQ